MGKMEPRKLVFRRFLLEKCSGQGVSNYMSFKFPWRLDGVKTNVQSVGIRECCIFMSVSSFYKESCLQLNFFQSAMHILNES